MYGRLRVWCGRQRRIAREGIYAWIEFGNSQPNMKIINSVGVSK